MIMLMLLLNYSMKESTATLYPFILGGTLSNNILNVFKRHTENSDL